MSKELTELQANIFRLAQTRDLSSLTYREIAIMVGVSHPYTVQQAINSLLDKGRLLKNRATGKIISATNDTDSSRPLISIPILGKVSCGPATELAEYQSLGFVSVSPSTARIRKPEKTFALIATGDSMDAARIHGKTVEDGDYVIVEKGDWPEAKDGDYIVSRFNEANNLKRLNIDRQNRRVILLSESISSSSHPPIIIAEEDMEYYAIEGIAIDVVKGVR